MYRRGLGLQIIGRFENHDGFDGVMLAFAGAGYHFEFTQCREHPVCPTPTVEDLLVLYIPSFEDWRRACADMLAAGFRAATAFNPYWEAGGRTFEDTDGYRIVLRQGAWKA
jgi:hypothetical protein